MRQLKNKAINIIFLNGLNILYGKPKQINFYAVSWSPTFFRLYGLQLLADKRITHFSTWYKASYKQHLCFFVFSRRNVCFSRVPCEEWEIDPRLDYPSSSYFFPPISFPGQVFSSNFGTLKPPNQCCLHMSPSRGKDIETKEKKILYYICFARKHYYKYYKPKTAKRTEKTKM